MMDEISGNLGRDFSRVVLEEAAIPSEAYRYPPLEPE